MRLVELRCQRIEAINGTLNELGKVRDEEQEARKIALGRILAEVTVDDVADGLERVEGNAKRQEQMGCKETVGGPEHAEYDVPILDVAQDAEVEQHDEKQEHPLAMLDALLDRLLCRTVGRILLEFFLELVELVETQTHQPDRNRGNADECEVLPTGEEVEAETAHEQNDPLRAAMTRSSDHEVDDDHEQQEAHEL